MTLRKKSIRILLLALVVAALCVVPAFASSAGNVADAVEQTWTDAAGQIKTVVNTVVFPALTMVLGIAFFVKVALCFFDYRKHGQFEWTGAAILFVCLIFVLLAIHSRYLQSNRIIFKRLRLQQSVSRSQELVYLLHQFSYSGKVSNKSPSQ